MTTLDNKLLSKGHDDKAEQNQKLDKLTLKDDKDPDNLSVNIVLLEMNFKKYYPKLMRL